MIKYFIRPASDWEIMKSKMEEALGHVYISPRYSIDGSLVVLKLDTENLPAGVLESEGFDKQAILAQLDTLTWTTDPSGENEVEL